MTFMKQCAAVWSYNADRVRGRSSV